MHYLFERISGRSRIARINVPLDNYELAMVVPTAETNCRHHSEQMRYLLREEAFRRGLLSHEHSVKQEEEQDGETAVASS